MLGLCLIVLELASHKCSEQAGGVGGRRRRRVDGARLLVGGVANERIAVKLVGRLRRLLLLLLLRQALLPTCAAVELEEAQQAGGAIVAAVIWPGGKPRRVLGLVHGGRRGGRGRRVIVGAVLGRVRLISVLLLVLVLLLLLLLLLVVLVVLVVLMIVGSLLVVVVRVELRAQVVTRGRLRRLMVLLLLVLRCSRRVVALMASGLLRMVRVLPLELGEE